MSGAELVAVLALVAILSAAIGGAAAILMVPSRIDAHTGTLKADVAELTDKLEHAIKRNAKRDRDERVPLVGVGPVGLPRSERQERLRQVRERINAKLAAR